VLSFLSGGRNEEDERRRILRLRVRRRPQVRNKTFAPPAPTSLAFLRNHTLQLLIVPFRGLRNRHKRTRGQQRKLLLHQKRRAPGKHQRPINLILQLHLSRYSGVSTTSKRHLLRIRNLLSPQDLHSPRVPLLKSRSQLIRLQRISHLLEREKGTDL